MKFIWISTLALAMGLSHLHAQNPILITFDQQKGPAQIVLKLLTQTWHIPRSLIELKSSHRPCRVEHTRVIHLCFENSGEMSIAKYNQEVVDESFRIFFQ